MNDSLPIREKFEYSGSPSLARPDLSPPVGWGLPLISSFNIIRNHKLSPDGKKIAFFWDREGSSDLYVLPSEGGWPKRISIDRGPIIPWDDEIPSWSANSHWLAFTYADHVYVASIEGGLPVKVTDFARSASSPVWLPGGDDLVVSVERYEAVQLVLTNRQGSWPKPLTDHAGGDAWDAQPSPDGKYIAYVYRPFNDLKRRDIRLIHLEDGSIDTLFGETGVYANSPRWHPENQQIAFLSQKSGFFEIWLVNLESGRTLQLTKFEYDVLDLAWSPDGKQIACIVNRGGSLELDLLEPIGGKSETIVGGKGCCSRPCWSALGHFLTVEYESSFHPPDIYRIDLPDRQKTQLTFSQIPAVASLDLKCPELVQYPSRGGLEIPAFLYRPNKANGAAVIYLHGGPNDQYMFYWDIFMQYLVAKGYTVLAPNYRGSTGYGVKYERLNHLDWGGGDVQDCLQAADFIASFPDVDPQRIASWGPSYGGYLTNCVLAMDLKYRFACGISVFGDADLLHSWALCSRRLRLYTEIYLGNPAENREVYQAGSPIRHVKHVRKPVLLLHGLQDDIVPPEASEKWANALRRIGKTYEYKTYASEPHGFLRRANRLDAWSRIERFLDWYLLPRGINLDE